MVFKHIILKKVSKDILTIINIIIFQLQFLQYWKNIKLMILVMIFSQIL